MMCHCDSLRTARPCILVTSTGRPLDASSTNKDYLQKELEADNEIAPLRNHYSASYSGRLAKQTPARRRRATPPEAGISQSIGCEQLVRLWTADSVLSRCPLRLDSRRSSRRPWCADNLELQGLEITQLPTFSTAWTPGHPGN